MRGARVSSGGAEGEATMSEKRAAPYKADAENPEEVYNEQRGSYRPPYGLIITVCVLVLLCGFGAGFGAGWAASDHRKVGNSLTRSGNSTTATNITNANFVRSFLPIDISSNASNAAVAVQYDQLATLNPALYALSVVISTLDNSTMFDANVLKVYLQAKYPPRSSNVIAKIFNVAQRLQVSPKYQSFIYQISTSFVDVFKYIRDNYSKISTGRRHMLAANAAEPIYFQVLQAFVRDALQKDVLSGATADLTTMFGFDELVALIVDTFDVIRNLLGDEDNIAAVARTWHSETSPSKDAPSNAVDMATNTTLPLRGTPVRYNPTVVGEDGDSLIVPVYNSGSATGRRLLDIPMPDGFTPAQPSDLPRLLVPVVFHIMLYQNSDGSYGPPNYQNAMAMAQRLVAVSNVRLNPSRFQLFVSEVRNNPVAYPYLNQGGGRDKWLSCSNGGFTYDLCPDFFRPAAADFPRSVNFFVIGENGPTDWVGYAFAPGDQFDPMWGHIVLTWTTFSTDGINNRASFEGGAQTLVHELVHHLGMQHTFSEGDTPCRDTDAIADTPITAGPVWLQPFNQKAYLACMAVWNSQYKGSWDLSQAASAARGSIPTTDQNSWADSCPAAPGLDELGNYLTYSYDICFTAVGHLTPGQITAIHRITYENNPILYTWGQYYALNPPPGAVPASPPPPPPPSPPPPGRSPPPPPVNRPVPSGGCGTESGCQCRASWDYNGATYSGCASIAAADGSARPWCAVDRSSGDCSSARNGWWDYCSQAANLNAACSSNNIGSRSVASPPPPPPPVATNNGGGSGSNCGAGAATVSGLSCTMKNWQCASCGSGTTLFTGCANPGNSKGKLWCALPKGTTSPTGAPWDFCTDACQQAPNNGNAASPPPPASSSNAAPVTQCTAGFGNLSPGCVCQPVYGVSWQGGGTYTNVQGCARFPEDSSRTYCLTTGCFANRNNNKLAACTCNNSGR